MVPNFFLIGAPKCGTTSLVSWLSRHDDVFMCTPKEPFYFSSDVKSLRAVRAWPDYLKLFEASEGERAIGEASTTYLRSEVAVPSIIEQLPEARFVVCLRNPVEMVASVHAQLVRGAREDVLDLRAALDLEPLRRKGKCLPSGTLEPADLFYSEVCALGSQLGRLYKVADRKKVHLVFMDDLKASPRKIWVGLQKFLGVADDGRSDFPVRNVRAKPRSPFATKVLRDLHRIKLGVLPNTTLSIGSKLQKLSERPSYPTERLIAPELRAALIQQFNDEVLMLEELTNRDLSAWREDTRPQTQ